MRAVWRAGAPLLVALVMVGCGGGNEQVRLPLPERPAHLTAGAGAAFAVLFDGRLYGTSGEAPRPLRTSVAKGPRGIALARGSLWAASPHAVVRIDPNGRRKPVRLPSDKGVVGLAAAGAIVWALHPDGALTRFGPQRALRSGAIPSALPNSRPVAIAASPGAVYVADRQGRLIRLDRLGRHARWIGVGKGAVDVAAGGGFAWVAFADGSVVQVRPRVGGWQTRRIETPGKPAAIAYGGNRGWVAETDGRVFTINAKSGARTLAGTAGAGVTDVAYASGTVWVARASGGRGQLVEVSP